MTYQILHFSDLHLDTSFATDGIPPSVGDWRRADLRAALGRILALARERRVDAVTIAGDLYEDDYVLPDTGEFLAQQFARLTPIRVLIAPGLHDPFSNRSLYSLTHWPNNVTIFRQGQITDCELAPNIRLWGAACPPARDHETLNSFSAIDRNGINLLLLHGMAEEQTTERGLFSLDMARLRSSNYDFTLLGGEHCGRLLPEIDPIAIYPGSPEPLRREESIGAHHVALLTIDNGEIATELIPVCQWHYHDLTIDLTECMTAKAAVDRVVDALKTLATGASERTICDVVLTGSPGFDLDTTTLRELLETKVHVRFDARLRMSYNIDTLALEQTVRGLLVQRFQSRIAAAESDHERQRAHNALHLALLALDGKQVHFQ